MPAGGLGRECRFCLPFKAVLLSRLFSLVFKPRTCQERAGKKKLADQYPKFARVESFEALFDLSTQAVLGPHAPQIFGIPFRGVT